LSGAHAWSKAKIVLWISYEMSIMYFTNSERNRVIYELWEKNLTIGEISSNTNIPRSTVGYYVRKFNRLAAKGKPVVFPGLSQGPRKQQGIYAEGSSAVSLLEIKILDWMRHGDWEGLYNRLNILKLLKEFGFLTGENRDIFLILLARDISTDRSTLNTQG